MPKTVENEEYFDTDEVMTELAASKKLFYTSIKSSLHAYHFDAKKKPWYRKRDVLALKAGRSVRKESIAISGMFGSWTAFARSQYGAETELRGIIDGTTLPQEALEWFHLPKDAQFVKRSRLTRIGGTVICTWDTYYPLELVSDIVEAMKHGDVHVVEHIAEKHHLVVGRNKDVYASRMTTLEEQNLFQLPADESVLVLQRASYTRDKSTLILFSDMALLGNWFVHEHEYEVKIWDE